jgi:hypothetical protein
LVSIQFLTYCVRIGRGSLGTAILTARLTADEERLLDKRSRGAGMKKATFVRQLIREEPFVTGADVVKDAERRAVCLLAGVDDVLVRAGFRLPLQGAQTDPLQCRVT